MTRGGRVAISLAAVVAAAGLGWAAHDGFSNYEPRAIGPERDAAEGAQISVQVSETKVVVPASEIWLTTTTDDRGTIFDCRKASAGECRVLVDGRGSRAELVMAEGTKRAVDGLDSDARYCVQGSPGLGDAECRWTAVSGMPDVPELPS